jgi:hypothetical protein
MPNLPVGVPMFCLNPVDVHFMLARQSHQAPRSVTVPVLLLVGIVRVHFLYLNPKICKCLSPMWNKLFFGTGTPQFGFFLAPTHN